MKRTLGHHWVKSAHGLWLPGDARGHWSEAYDAEIGFIEPHMLHEGDPVRLRMARERMKHPPVRWTAEMIDIMVEVMDRCQRVSPWSIAAATIEPTHFHVLITASHLDIDRTVKWMAQELTKAIHQQTNHSGPVFAKGNWCEFIFDQSHWNNLISYIERHNVRHGLDPRPYAFLHAAV